MGHLVPEGEKAVVLGETEIGRSSRMWAGGAGQWRCREAAGAVGRGVPVRAKGGAELPGPLLVPSRSEDGRAAVSFAARAAGPGCQGHGGPAEATAAPRTPGKGISGGPGCGTLAAPSPAWAVGRRCFLTGGKGVLSEGC